MILHALAVALFVVLFLALSASFADVARKEKDGSGAQFVFALLALIAQIGGLLWTGATFF